MQTRRPARRFFRQAAAASARILFVVLIGSTTLYAQLEQQAPAAPTLVADATPPPRAVTPDVDVAGEATPVNLLVGRSTLIDLGSPIARVSLTSAEIADAMVTAPSQLLLHGKVPGSISMLIWNRAGAVSRFEVAVQRDLSRLTEQVKELFPNEKIGVHANGRQVVLSGNVTSADVIEKAKNLAHGFVDRTEDVVALMQLQPARSNQVLLRVRFAEVSRNALTELGVSFFTGPTGIENTLGRVTTQQFPSATFSDLAWTKDSNDFGAAVTSAEGKINFSDFLNLFLFNQRYDLGMLVKALSTQGLFQTLAEPNLVAESGKEASFLAGGEFPIPIAQGSGNNASITVSFKEFGIRLNFVPTVDGDRVRLKVRPEVSTLDYANAVVLQGFRIPALTTRRTETELELRDGQTFAIAGLMNNQMNSTMQKIPGIGDIPILGYLFRSKAAQKGQTELVVMITPEILPVGSSGVTPNLPRMLEPWLPVPQENKLLPPPSAPFLPGRNQLTPGGDSAPQPRAEAPVAPAPAGDAAQGAAAQRAAEDARQQELLAARERAEAERYQKAQAEADKKAAEEARKQAELDERAEAQALKEEEAARKAAAEAAKRQEEADRKAAAEARKQAERDQREMADRLARESEEARKAAEVQAKADKAEKARLEKLAKEQAKRDAEAAEKAREQSQREAERESERQQQVAAAEAKLRAAFAEYQAKVGKPAAQ